MNAGGPGALIMNLHLDSGGAAVHAFPARWHNGLPHGAAEGALPTALLEVGRAVDGAARAAGAGRAARDSTANFSTTSSTGTISTAVLPPVLPVLPVLLIYLDL